MKKVLIIVALLIVAAVAAFFILGRMSKSGNPHGLTDGRLVPCPRKPNCVRSEPGTGEDHFSDPIPVPASWSGRVLPELERTIRDMGGEIQSREGNYLAATFSSAVFRFTDDFEIRVDPEENLIHFRSASRVGYSDLGANKKRVERLRELLKAEK